MACGVGRPPDPVPSPPFLDCFGFTGPHPSTALISSGHPGTGFLNLVLIVIVLPDPSPSLYSPFLGLLILVLLILPTLFLLICWVLLHLAMLVWFS